jgi:hypothetical protein
MLAIHQEQYQELYGHTSLLRYLQQDFDAEQVSDDLFLSQSKPFLLDREFFFLLKDLKVSF